MKDGLIKINGYDALYYDSDTKQYKSKMFCPACGRSSGCFCYEDFDSIPMTTEELPNFYCSDRCFVLDNDVDEIAEALGITVKPDMEEWNASKIVKAFMEDFDGDCGDVPSGGMCEL